MSLPARNRGKEFALTANVFNFKSTLDRFQSNACVSATSGADDRFTVSLFLFLLITILSLFFFEGDIRLENIRVLSFPQKTRTFNESIRGRLKNLASNVSLLPHTERESVVAKNARKSSVFDISRKKEKKNFSQAAMQKKGEERTKLGGGGGRWYLRGPNNPNKEQTARVMEKGRLQGGLYTYTHRKKEKEK